MTKIPNFILLGAFVALCVAALAVVCVGAVRSVSGAQSKKIDPNTETVPYAGIAAMTQEEIAAQLDGKSAAELDEIMTRLRDERLFADALVVAKRIVDDPKSPEAYVLKDLSELANFRAQTGAYKEFEADLAAILEARPDSWRVKVVVADLLGYIPQVGYYEDGVFKYVHDWSRELLSTEKQTRIRKLQLYQAALPAARAEFADAAKAGETKTGKAQTNADKDLVRFGFDTETMRNRFYYSFVSTLANGNVAYSFWQLQTLTDIDVLPEPEPLNQAQGRNRRQGAPVDANGNPITFKTPDSFEAAENDGERIQALRAEQFEYGGKNDKYAILIERASEARSLFGVETLASYRYFNNEDSQTDALDGIMNLRNLADNETIAKLATGVKRFQLPQGYEYIDLYREALEYAPTPHSSYSARAQIAQEYQSRRQLSRAADEWRSIIEYIKSNRLENDPIMKNAKNALSQIVDPRVQFDAGATKVAGTRMDLALKYRNATEVELSARELNVDKALEQLKDQEVWRVEGGYSSLQRRLTALIEAEYLKPVNDAEKNRRKRLMPLKDGFVGAEVARVTERLTPDENHYDSVVSIDSLKLKPGAYLIEAKAKDGNVDCAVVWLRDRTVQRRPTGNGNQYFIVDSETGEPQVGIEAETRFVRVRRLNTVQRVEVTINSEFVKTDSRGSFLVPNSKVAPDKSNFVLIVIPSKDPKAPKQFSFMDSENFWVVTRGENLFQQQRAYFISDRPIYRPKQTAHFTLWVGNAQYDAPTDSNIFAGQEVAYVVMSPTGEVVEKKEHIKLDEYGAFEGSFEIPEDAKLGVYSLIFGRSLNEYDNVDGYLGDGSFRLEEYRKPEFKVTVDAPKDPVTLGDSFKATVKANYYFGAPVANATVKYKVTRNAFYSNYFPPRYWDWFYGPGYWQFSYFCGWYPGAELWCCRRVPPFYMPRSTGVPEIVEEGEAEIGANGEFEISIDSSLAKQIYPNDDQQYEIEAEVTDASRRVIVGKGKVYAARRPFQTLAWFDRGYYKVGDRMTASFQARRIDGKPVVGKALVKLFKIQYEEGDANVVKPIETEVFGEELVTDASGQGAVEISATAPGQYRLSCVVETETGAREEGGQLIMIRGARPDGKASTSQARGDYRFNALEIIPEKAEYAVGETARVQIASNRADGYVLLTTRTEFGISAEETKVVKLENGVAYVDIPIEAKDQPNFFVEASTVFEGEFYNEVKEIVVPPEKRVLDVAVEPVKDRVRPGEKTTIKLRLTDPNGDPVVGRTVATIYDKSLDDLVGGSNLEDVREFFWKWRRHSNASTTSSLNQGTYFDVFYQIYNRDPETLESRMQPIGAFGDVVTMSASTLGGMGGAKNGLVGGMGGMAGGMRRAERKGVMFKSRARDFDDDMMVAEEADVEMESLAMDAAAPAPAAAPMMAMARGAVMEAKEEAAFNAPAQAAEAGEEAPLVEAKVRTNLADLAFWAADLTPNDNGEIELEVDMPDNLTTWKIAAWSVGSGLRVGSGESEIITSKDVIIRMQKPRFLTRTDEVTLSANVHNYLESEKKVQVSLEVASDADSVSESDSAPIAVLDPTKATQTIVVPSQGEARVDWIARAENVGTAILTMKALTNEESDAVQEKITIKEHGIDKQIAVSGVVSAKSDDEKDADDSKAIVSTREAEFVLNVPAERREDSTKLTLRFSPTLAGAIFDALPYMMEYPYGCTEQTLNKFLPLVIAQKAAVDCGVDLAALKDKRANLNAQELGDASVRAQRWNKRPKNSDYEPVFDLAEGRKRAEVGIERLAAMQNPDGGWGWFYGYGESSSPRQTALIARGLKLALDSDAPVDQSMIDRGRNYLIQHEREEALKLIRGKVWSDEKKSERASFGMWRDSAYSEDAFIYYALSELDVQPAEFNDSFVNYETGDYGADVANDPAKVHAIMKEFIWEARSNLELYPISAYAIALTSEPNRNAAANARIETILRRLAQYRAVDDENQTVRLDSSRVDSWRYWSWFGSDIETQAFYLKLLNRVDAAILKKVGIEKDAPALVKYLLNNRKNATYWYSTRDTALCVEAFAEYLMKTNELAPRQTVKAYLDGELLKTVEYTPENVFLVDGTIEIPASEISSGDHKIKFVVDGDGPLYYNAYLEFFTLEDPIEKAGLEVKIERRYYKLVEKKDATALVEGGRGQAITQRVEAYDKVPLKTGDAVTSGDRIEVELLIDSKNDYESLLIEDAKPAGFEAIDALSGYKYDGLRSYVEYRDDRVCLFVENLPEGRSSTTYRLRAETPGKFSALPSRIYGMYAPELKGNSDEFKFETRDKD